MSGMPEIETDKGGSAAYRADGGFIFSPFAPTHGAPPFPAGASKSWGQADLLVLGQDPFPNPLFSLGDRTIWEVLRD